MADEELYSRVDEVGSLPEDQQEHHFSLATERSHLARDIQNIYHDLCNTGEVRMYINKWLELSFCLPEKLHKKHFPNILVEPEIIFECLAALRPLQSLDWIMLLSGIVKMKVYLSKDGLFTNFLS